MSLSENIRRVGMEPRGRGLDGAVGVGARIEASGRTVERWRPGSWAVCLVGRPLVSLDVWAVLGPSPLALNAT